MGKVYATLDDTVASFIGRQHLFFVATAPLAAKGHPNVSPKGLDSFRILDSATVAYLDLTGSGIETVAHLRENGRITLLFCAFEGPPKIMRLYGHGVVVEPGDADFAVLRDRFPPHGGVRAIIRVRIDRISDSCGFGVPRYHFEQERTQLPDWVARQGPERLETYQATHNHSIDGLAGLRRFEGG